MLAKAIYQFRDRQETSPLIQTKQKSQNSKEGLKLLGKVEKIMPVTVWAFSNADFNSETCQMPIDINPMKSCGGRDLHECRWKWTDVTVSSNKTQEKIQSGKVLGSASQTLIVIISISENTSRFFSKQSLLTIFSHSLTRSKQFKQQIPTLKLGHTE